MELGISEASGPAARPPFDPELALVFEAIGDSAASMTPETTPAMRAVAAANTMSVADLRQRPELQLTEHVLPGAGGRPDLEVLLVRPARREAPLPGIFFVHGGGYVLGSHLLGLDDVLDWVVDVGVVVVSVAYRLAPEHRYPAPLEDCYAGLLWMADRAEALGGDPDQLFLHGKSAGGGLAAGLALLARDRNGPDLAGQILLSPMLDDRASTPSSQELGRRRCLGPHRERHRLGGLPRRRGRHGPCAGLRSTGASERSDRPAAHLPRRGVGGDVSRRGRRLRRPAVARRRSRRATCLAGGLPRFRRLRSDRCPVAAGPGSVAGLVPARAAAPPEAGRPRGRSYRSWGRRRRSGRTERMRFTGKTVLLSSGAGGTTGAALVSVLGSRDIRTSSGSLEGSGVSW